MPSPDGIDRARAAWLEERAIALWPRLDRRKVRRCGGDARCIVRVVSRRTTLPADVIWRILLLPLVTEDEGRIWFG
jgi:hypothetical protein